MQVTSNLSPNTKNTKESIAIKVSDFPDWICNEINAHTHHPQGSDGVDAFRTNQNDSELRHSEHLEVELPNVAPGTTFIEDMDLTVNKDVARMVAQLSMSTQIYIVGAQVGYSVAAKYKHLLEVERGGSKSNKSELDTLEQNYRREIQALSTDASAALENQLIQSRKLLRRCLERLRASVEDETYNRIWIDKVIQECRGIYDSWDTEVVLPAVEDIN